MSNITPAHLTRALEENYGIVCLKIRALQGYNDYNFHCTAHSGEYFVKVYGNSTEEIVRFHTDLIKLLAQGTVPVAKIIPTHVGTAYFTLGNLFGIVQEYLPYENLSERKNLAPSLVEDCGRTIGRCMPRREEVRLKGSAGESIRGIWRSFT